MADDPSKRGKQVRDWAQSLGCSEEEIRDAVAKVGPMVKDVKAHLQDNR